VTSSRPDRVWTIADPATPERDVAAALETSSTWEREDAATLLRLSMELSKDAALLTETRLALLAAAYPELDGGEQGWRASGP
jgi:hypothetical protein